jgi:AraC-like DNA-binding protein
MLTSGFKRLFGSTPKAHQIQTRIAWVCHAISSQPDRKIESIASEAGYSDIADFNHFFHKQTGMSPRQYQEESKDT